MKDSLERAKLLLEKLDLDKKKLRFKEIEAQSTDPDFWKDNAKATILMKEMGAIQKELESAEKIKSMIDSSDTSNLEELVSELESSTYLSGRFDRGSAIVSIHAGQGGVDAMDWAQMLSRMYQRYFEKKK